MKLVAALFVFLATQVTGPLFVAEWHATLMDGAVQVDIPVGLDASIIPLPPEMVKAGWFCSLSKRDKAPGAVIQSIVCHLGNVGDSVAATAVCMTVREDVDIQRVTVGNPGRNVSITLGCHTLRSVGASI